MNVLEIKNNLVKIAYDVSDNLALSEFVIIEDSNSPYVGQIMNLKSDTKGNFAIVKLLFTFNQNDAILKNYNGTIPSVNAIVSKLPSKELLDIIPVDSPIILGNLAQQNFALKVDKSIFENNLLICSDNFDNTYNLLDNITKQIDDKIVIIDCEGKFNKGSRVTIGKDFKLPLNSDAIDYIYENDLEDVDAVNKSIIQDVLLEVQDYIKTLPENFLPFDSFINVIDSQYRETNIPELILLKNKLLKYKEKNIFAQDLKEILELTIAVEHAEFLIIDVSIVSENVQKYILGYIYTVLKSVGKKIYSFIKINNSNVSKKLLKTIVDKDNNLYSTIICPHELKYINELKEIAQNIIFYAPLNLTHDFASYNAFLNKLNSDEFVIYGAHTQNIPLIVENVDYQTINKNLDIMNEHIDEPENIVPPTMPKYPDVEKFEKNETLEEETIDTSMVEETDDVSNIAEESDNYEIVEEIQPAGNILEETTDENIAEEDVITEDIEIESLDSDEVNEYEVIQEGNIKIEDIPEETIEAQIIEENNDAIVEQVAKDVDKVFYGEVPNNTEDDDILADEELTDEDLNIIEDLSVDDENIELAGDEIVDVPPVDEEQPPIVPIYPAENLSDNENSDEIQDFEPGQRVSTAKYGEGVVEKMIKYGNKMLCSIDFPKIGRRLLDPAVTEINKI